MRKRIRIIRQNASAILDGNDHHSQCKYNFSNHSVESFHFTLYKKNIGHANIFDSFFLIIYFTLLKIESTWPTTKALGKLTNMHKEKKT